MRSFVALGGKGRAVFPFFVVQVPPEASFLEELSWFATIALALVTTITLLYIRRQIEEAATARKQELKIAHASAILEMDARWEAPEMKTARQAFVRLHEEVMRQVGSGNPKMNDAARSKLIRKRWTERLGELRDSDETAYGDLMRMCSFFETLGLLVKRGYAEKDDVVGLFKGPILAIGEAFEGHIQEQLKEMGVPDGLYEHALFLCADCQRTIT